VRLGRAFLSLQVAEQQRITTYLNQYAISCQNTTRINERLRAHEKWQRAIVVPLFAESPSWLDSLPSSTAVDLLVIAVLNRPDHVADLGQNDPLRSRLERIAPPRQGDPFGLARLSNKLSVLWLDLEQLEGATPSQEGVGRARRIGFDCALSLYAQGRLNSPWIFSSDGDAVIPAALLEANWSDDAAATTLPFAHFAQGNALIDAATDFYELRLHYYVLGLEYAGSPYAYHTLGSAFAVNAPFYAAVRGIPLKNAAEDFYMLNKLAKVGRIHRVAGPVVDIASRVSDRVPFGTGPAVRALVNTDPSEAPLFYQPQIFNALKMVLQTLQSFDLPPHRWSESLRAASCGDQGLTDIVPVAIEALEQLGVADALTHCQRQGRTARSRAQHFHTWLDGFKTLKFIHNVRDRGYANCTLRATQQELNFWPTRALNTQTLLDAVRRRWLWVGPTN